MSSLPTPNGASGRAEATLPKVGRVLAGRYRLVELLAQGGMANVYRAVTEGEPREVAVKIMHPTLAREASFARRFQRETGIAARLVHQRIARMLDHGVDSGLYFLVMELLVGEDLFDVIRRQGTLDDVSARRVVIEVCEALAEAHGLGVVHRDMKLENVFVARGVHGDIGVKVLDFGVAKIRDREDKGSGDSMPALTAAGVLLGTPEYMSPEQCRGEAPGPEGDIYACGVLLYTLLTGRPPFVGKSPVEVILKHVSDLPQPPSALRSGIDPALEALVLRTLAKDPARRPPGAAALAEALRALGKTPPLVPEAIGFTVRPRQPTSAASEEARPDDRSKPALPVPSALSETMSTLPAPPAVPRFVALVLASPSRLFAALLLVLVVGILIGRFGVPR